MSPEKLQTPPQLTAAAAMSLQETELTLGLPGTETRGKSGTKRIFLETVDLNLRVSDGGGKVVKDSAVSDRRSENGASKAPAAKNQVVGWPPVRSFRKNAMTRSCKYVKVAADGAPYLRKVDLETYDGYEQLIAALGQMFTKFTIRNYNYLSERKVMNEAMGVEYVATYEDKDGDWMLVGDVPWKMFVESCKRLRLMKSFDAIGPENSRSYEHKFELIIEEKPEGCRALIPNKPYIFSCTEAA